MKTAKAKQEAAQDKFTEATNQAKEASAVDELTDAQQKMFEAAAKRHAAAAEIRKEAKAKAQQDAKHEE